MHVHAITLFIHVTIIGYVIIGNNYVFIIRNFTASNIKILEQTNFNHPFVERCKRMAFALIMQIVPFSIFKGLWNKTNS